MFTAGHLKMNPNTSKAYKGSDRFVSVIKINQKCHKSFPLFRLHRSMVNNYSSPVAGVLKEVSGSAECPITVTGDM